MKQALQDLRDFHRASGTIDPTTPQWPSRDKVALRVNLIKEEWYEFIEALLDRDIVEVADALADLCYVVLGTALAFGIPLDQVWDEVHRSNMAKIDPATGKLTKRADGKVLKPEGWTPPDVAGILARASAR